MLTLLIMSKMDTRISYVAIMRQLLFLKGLLA